MESVAARVHGKKIIERVDEGCEEGSPG